MNNHTTAEQFDASENQPPKANNPESDRGWNIPESQNGDETVAESPSLAEKKTHRDFLLAMVEGQGCELFHDRSYETYISIPSNGHRENHPLRSSTVVRYLRNLWYSQTGSVCSGSTITDVIGALDAKAARGGNEKEIFIRVAHFEVNGEQQILVDLCDAGWRAVQIQRDGWDIIQNPPVKFVRKKGMLPLPEPTRTGTISNLRPLINAGPDEIWVAIVAWLLSAFSPGPYPILILLGEQGSAKSFLCRVLRRFIDPSEVEITTAPREARDVIIAAQNSHVIALDNLSAVVPWLSDLLCSIATGAAYRERKYHTNNGDEELFKAKRPIVMNGIDFATRDDLLNRAFVVQLPTIPDTDRKDEREILKRLDEETPAILGGIFDILSSVLSRVATTTLESKPRMADCALWVTAAEPALGWDPGTFMRVYNTNREHSIELALESDSFGAALRDFMDRRTHWKGNWQDLIRDVHHETNKSESRAEVSAYDRPPREWPTNAKKLAIRLKRLAPALRHVGIHYEHQNDGNKRFYSFWTDESEASKTASPRNANTFNNAISGPLTRRLAAMRKHTTNTDD